MSNVYETFGTQLKRGDGGSPEVFATIGGISDIDGPAEEVRVEEYLTHDMAEATVRKIATVKDSGEITTTLYWDPTDTVHTLLRSDKDNRVARNFQLVEPFVGGETASFTAYVTKLGKAYPVEGLMAAEFTLSIDGAVVWA